MITAKEARELADEKFEQEKKLIENEINKDIEKGEVKTFLEFGISSRSATWLTELGYDIPSKGQTLVEIRW